MSDAQAPESPAETTGAEKQASDKEPRRSDDQLTASIRATREELARTLDALEYKLDIPARTAEWVDTKRSRIVRRIQAGPFLAAGIAVAGAALVAGVIIAVVRLPRRKR